MDSVLETINAVAARVFGDENSVKYQSNLSAEDCMLLEKVFVWKDEPNNPKNNVFGSQHVGLNIDNLDQLRTELDTFSAFAGDI